MSPLPLAPAAGCAGEAGPLVFRMIRPVLGRMIVLVALLTVSSGCRPRPAQQAGSHEPPESVGASSDESETIASETVSLGAPLNAHAPELKIKKSAQVSILGYHDFTTGKSSNPMVINIQKFRQQMQSLKDARLNVISMENYLRWRRGETDIPDPAVMITIDDGWKSVHTLALPVLKEFGYPFTIFLYRNFVNGGGRALTTAEIKELMASGATVASHSVSHPFPAEFRQRARHRPRPTSPGSSASSGNPASFWNNC